MEILQTIWTALSTSNPEFTNIIILPFALIEISVYTLLFTTILNLHISKKNFLLFVLSLSGLSVLSTILTLNNFISPSIAQVLKTLLSVLLTMIIFKTSIIKSLLTMIIPTIFMSLFESFFVLIFTSCFSIRFDDILNIPIYRISLLLLIYSGIYIVSIISKKIKFNIVFLDNIDRRNKGILLINSIFGVIALIAQLYLFRFYAENMPYLYTALSVIGLVIYFFISLYSLTKTVQLQKTQQDLVESQLYNKSLKILHDNNRAFKHDFSNIVQAIGGYVSTGDMNGLQVYYSQLLGDCQKVNNLYGLSPEVINNPGIYSILASKYHKADELGIKINLDVFLNLKDLNMPIYEFTRILGILMDNAVEAAQECEEKIINVEIRKDFQIDRQLLIIENTYKDKDIDMNKIFEKSFSTKPNNTGLGLWEVRQIIRKNVKYLDLYTTKDETFFKQQFEMYPSKAKLQKDKIALKSN